MGTFPHPITFHSDSDGHEQTVEALVDTGSTFASVPAPVLEGLGVTPEGVVRLRLADGRTGELPIGAVMAELDGVVRTVPCVFGNPDSPAVIGAVALEIFLLSVDPVEQRLVPVEGYWL